MISISKIILLYIAGVVSASPVANEDKSLLEGRFTGTKYLITFGDSYSQTGFDITLSKASSSNPLGNPTFPGYTTSGGPNWIGYLVKTFETSLTLSYNFAYGGATVDASIINPGDPTIRSLVNQTALFSANLASKPSYAPWTSNNTLFGIWMGVNDVANTYGQSSANQNVTIGKVLTRYFGLAQTMYDAGGRNFLFLTVPPIQKAPVNVGSSGNAAEASTIANWNSQLTARAAAFKSSNSNSTVWVYDTQVPFNTALSNPSAYGASSASCYNSDGVSCLWWNNYHPGQAIHKLVAHGIADALKGSFF